MPLSRFPVTLTDGTPVRVRSGAGVHVRDLDAPTRVRVHTPVGVHDTMLDPQSAFGRAGRRRTADTPVTSLPHTYLAVHAALDSPHPSTLAPLAGAHAQWVRQVLVGTDDLGVVGQWSPARRASALAIIAAHPVLRDSADAAELVWRELSAWAPGPPSALLRYTLERGRDVELLARVGRAESEWRAERLLTMRREAPEQARARLRQVWSEQMARLSPRMRITALDRLTHGVPGQGPELLSLPASVRDMLAEVVDAHGIPSHPVLRCAREAVVAAATRQDVLCAVSASSPRPLRQLMAGARLPERVYDEVSLEQALVELDAAGLPAHEVIERKALLTGHLGRTYEVAMSGRPDKANGADQYTSVMSGEAFASAVLANPYLSAADRRRYMRQIHDEERRGESQQPFDLYQHVAARLMRDGDPQAAYHLLVHDPECVLPEAGDVVAAAWRTWSAPQQRKALRQRDGDLLQHLTRREDIERIREHVAHMADPPAALRTLAARTPGEVLESIKAVPSVLRWNVLPAIVNNPDLNVFSRAQMLTCADMTEAAGTSFAGSLSVALWGYGSDEFRRRIEQAAQELSAPHVYGTQVISLMPPTMVWLAAYTLVHEPDEVETAMSLAQDWHDTPAALAAAVTSLLRD